MCAQAQERGIAEPQERRSAAATAPSGASQELRKALADFRQAVASKRAESVREAFQALRVAALAGGMKGPETLRLADEAVGQPAGNLLAVAFTRGQCFMCSGGAARCDHCGGSGFLGEERSCPRCDGLAVSECGFCGGTGWPDESDVPEELAAAVARRRQAQAQEDIRRVAGHVAKLKPELVGQLSENQRRAVAGLLIGLAARLSALSRCDSLAEQERDKMVSVADKLDACLDMLRR